MRAGKEIVSYLLHWITKTGAELEFQAVTILLPACNEVCVRPPDAIWECCRAHVHNTGLSERGQIGRAHV